MVMHAAAATWVLGQRFPSEFLLWEAIRRFPLPPTFLMKKKVKNGLSNNQNFEEVTLMTGNLQRVFSSSKSNAPLDTHKECIP